MDNLNIHVTASLYVEAKDIKTSSARLLELLADEDRWVRVYVAAHPNLPQEQIEALAEHRDRWVRAFAARNPNVPENILIRLAGDALKEVRRAVARNPGTPRELLAALAKDVDSTSIQIHPDGTGALKKTSGNPSENSVEEGIPKFIGLLRMTDRLQFSLSPGQVHDAPEGRLLLEGIGPMKEAVHLLMDRAYEGNETRQLVIDLGYSPVFSSVAP